MKTKKNKQNVFSLRLKNGINIMLNNRLVLRVYDFGKSRETEIMAVDYTIYENWYKYMSSVLNQIQGGADYQGTSLAGRAAVSDQSFTREFMNTLQRLRGNTVWDAAGSGSVYGAGRASAGREAAQIQTGSESMDAIFEEAAERYNVPLNLLKAIGKAESGFNANAVSPAGAQGVMQLMPSTARALGVDDPFDARSNIMGGARYIAEKLNQYNGDIELALAAYNAGSGNVAKYGGVPPFAETRNYISRIKGYMNGDLTTGKTVEKSASGSESADGDSHQLSGTSLNYQDWLQVGLSSGYLSAAGSKSLQSTYDLTKENAQYFVDMMRLQMLSRVSSLSTLNWSSDNSDGNNFFL